MSRRIARRYVTTSLQKTGVLAHVDRDGIRWGWFSHNTPRLHLVPFDDEHQGAARVWLEDTGGVRCFQVVHEPVDGVLNLDALRASVARSRDSIESDWIRSCASKGWLDYSPADGTITLYGGTPNELVRRVRGLPLFAEGLQLDSATNTLYIGIRLNRMLWRGRDDGSDAENAVDVRTGR